jgi:hypothetical protein
MSRSVTVQIGLILDVKKEPTLAEVKQQIEYAMNAACSFLEQSEIRDPKGAGVYYELKDLEEL